MALTWAVRLVATVARSKGVAEYLIIDGVLARLLIGADSQPLQGADGQYLYGRIA